MFSFHRIALCISFLAATSAIGLLATIAIAVVSPTVDQIALELPLGIFGLLLLPIFAPAAGAAAAVARRWYPNRTSTTAAVVAATSLAVWLGFLLWI